MSTVVTGVRLRVVVALATCVASAACDGPWRHDMFDQPSRHAAAGPRSPAYGSIPLEAKGPLDRESGESVRNPLPADGPVTKGRALYEIYCTPCHDGAVARFLPNVPPLGSHEVQRHGDGWLYATITNGTRVMPSYGHELDPAERWEIVRFVRTFAHP
jgi:S-disulfanyl-L-cysteine oxidoreductase SoxD